MRKYRRPSSNRLRFGRRQLRSVGLVVCLLPLLAVVGCQESEPTNTLPNPLVVADAQGNSDLEQALDFLTRMDEFERSQASEKILYHLKQWISKQPDSPNWVMDPVVANLPPQYQGLASAERLRAKDFEPYDTNMLQEAIWLRGIARTTIESTVVPPDLTQTFLDHEQVTGAPVPEELRQATLLFDWTVRNLQLDQDVGLGDTHRMDSDLLLYAWEALMMGRGTLEEKSRVFVLLARQIGLPVVMLAMFDPSTEAAPRPWLPALYLDNQLYLFDMRWGVPIPGPEGKGIARLEQVMADPGLLSQLDISPDATYPFTAEDLEEVIALVDATPAYLSHRMKLLEGALVGEQKLVLTANPSALATELLESPGIRGIGLWTLPYQAFAARSQLQELQRAQPGAAAIVGLGREFALFDPAQTPLLAARVSHFRGTWNDDEARAGARRLYLESRTPDAQIEAIGNIPLNVPPEQQGQVTPERMEQHKARLREVQQLMRRTKENATLWLALLAYERGQYQVAIDYLKPLVDDSDSAWSGSASYNLGRALESLGKTQSSPEILGEAAAAYASVPNGPVAAASQWRATQLRSDTPTAEGPQATPETSEAEEPSAEATTTTDQVTGGGEVTGGVQDNETTETDSP